MKKLMFTLLTIFFFSNFLVGQGQVFSRQGIQEDLFFLQLKLEERHPNIDIYTTKENFNDFFQNIEIPDSLSEVEAYSLVTLSNKVIKDGHTLFYPNLEYRNKNNLTGHFLPMQPYWDGENLFVLKNHSKSKELKEGSEIISINGIESKELVHQMLLRMMRDGNNFNYPTWVLNTYFFEYYSYFHGCSKEYEMIVKEGSNEKKIAIQGIKKAQLLKLIVYPNSSIKKGIFFKIDEDSNTGVLTIKDWHNDVLKKVYNQRFKPEIKNIIQEIEDSNIQNLVIDVRNNQGGDTRNSKYLLSYLMQEPFTLVDGYKRKKSGKMVRSRGPQMGIHKPVSSTFKGKISVLINGGSFSNTGIFCSALKKQNRATFIGEETGGSEFVLSSYAKAVRLPNTGIIIDLPRLQFIIKPYDKEDLHGVSPDFIVKPHIESLIKGEDEAMKFALDNIN